jgi:AmmeMemoRadiSam system protein B
MFSGPVAANGFYALASDGPVEEFIIVGPNHTGVGSGVSIMREGIWRTPLGEVSIDSGLADKIRSESTLIDVDETAHAMEHSIEVQLPFLQSLFGSDFRFVPICMMMQDLQTSREVGSAIGHAATGMNLIIIASSDMTHYESHERAVTKDQAAIDAILKLDEELLQAVVESKGISMCGYGPVSVAIVAAKLLGATRAKLLAYATSGDITGEKYAVVGYASISIEKP